MKLYLIFLIFGFGLLAHDWKLEKDQNDIQVYSKDATNADYKNFKAISVFPYPLKSIEKVLTNPAAYSQWIDRNILSEVLKEDENYIYYRCIYDAPFPIQDRDLVAKIKLIELDENHIRMEVTQAPGLYPESEDHIRVTVSYGQWDLFRISETQTKVQYLGHSDPGGYVPTWFVNSFAVDGPFNTMQNLRERLGG